MSELETAAPVSEETAAPVSEETAAPEVTSVPFEETAIPETYKDNQNVSKYKNVGELIKGYENQSKLIGAKGVIIPGKDATPEEKEKYYQTLGKPVKAEEYKLSDVQLHPKIKEQYNENVSKVFKDMAHQANLSQEQADFVHKWYFENASKAEISREQATDKAIKDGETALRADWKGDYDKNLANAKKVVAKFGGEEAIKALGDLGSHPVIVKMMGNIAKNFAEDMISDTKTKGTEGADSAKAKIKEINAKIISMKGNEPDYQDLLNEKMRLYDEAFKESV